LICAAALYSQPANDICQDAIELSADGSCLLTIVPSGTTNSNEPNEFFHCGSNFPREDIWYKTVVPSTGELSIEAQVVGGTSPFVTMEAFNGGCGSLAIISCNDRVYTDCNEDRNASLIELDGLTPGEVIFVRIAANVNVAFNLCVSDATTSVQSYISLIAPGTQGTCDPATNTYQQEFLVHHRNGTGFSVHPNFVNSSSIILTQNPQSIFLDLPAHGEFFRDLFFDLPSANCSQRYEVGAVFESADNCFQGTVPNDECMGALPLTLESTCDNIFSLLGASSSSDEDYCFDNQQDVWFFVDNPLDGEVIISTSFEGLSPRSEVFEGDCSNLVLLDCFGGDFSFRYQGSASRLYIRVTQHEGTSQDEFGVCAQTAEFLTNDICSDAITLNVDEGCLETVYSTHTASFEGDPTSSSTCDNTGSDTHDIWFSMITPTGDIPLSIIMTSMNGNSFTGILEVFTGSCTNLNLEDCILDGGSSTILAYSPTFAAGTEVFLRVSSRGNFNHESFNICVRTIENDVCSGATELAVDGSCIAVDNSGSGASNNPGPFLPCGDRNENGNDDFWFSAIVPASGNLTVSTNIIQGGPEDMIMAAYEGNCNSLIPIACNERIYNETSGFSFMPRIELEDRTPGERIYFRLVGSYDGNKGPFEICASDEIVSGNCFIDLFEILESSDCDPVTNTYDQEVLIYHRLPLNSNAFIDIRSGPSNVFVPVESSPQVVTLEELPASGFSHNIEVQVVNQPSECERNGVYTAVGILPAVENCFAGMVPNDSCIGALEIMVNSCQEYDNIGSTPSGNVYCTNSEFQDVWFRVMVPPSGELGISSYFTDSRVNVALFEGDCNNLVFHSCISENRGARIENLTAGEFIYLRAIERSGGQNRFGLCVFDPEPDTNETCMSAVDLSSQGICDNNAVYSTHLLTPSNLPSATISCDEDVNNPSEDMWFVYDIPSDARYAVEILSADNNFSGLAAEIFRGSCDNLSIITCGNVNVRDGGVILPSGDLSAGERIFIRIAPSGFFNRQAFFTVCISQVENDICTNAVSLSLEDSCAPASVNLAFNTPSGVAGSTECNDLNSTLSDAWYQIIVDEERDISIQATATNELFFARAALTVYTDNCGSLTEIACAVENENNGGALLVLRGRSIGETLFIRVANRFNEFVELDLCVVYAPANDNCDSAVELALDECSTHNLQFATASRTPQDFLSCGNRNYGNGFKDLWFSASVPSSGNLKIETFADIDGIDNTDIEVYRGTCDGLVALACNTEKELFSNIDKHGLLELSDLVPLEILFIRVGSDDEYELSSFEICITDIAPSNTCAINHVRVVSSGDCIGNPGLVQPVIELSYRENGTSSTVLINDVSYPLTGSPQIINLEPVEPDGSRIDIEASLESNQNSCRINSTYYAEEAIDLPFCRPSNNFCSSSIQLEIGDECVDGVFDLSRASESLPTFACANAGDFIRDVWFTFEIPMSGDVIINTYELEIEAAFEVYEGSCGNLERLDECGLPYRSVRISGRLPGEILYIRVVDINSNEEGEFGLCIFRVEPFTNDICETAIEFSPTHQCETLIYSGHFNSSESFPTPTLSCDGSGVPSRDMWFRIPMTSGGDITIETIEVENGVSPVLLEIYEGDCVDLSLVYCDYGGGQNGHSRVNVLGAAVGNSLYVRVAGLEGESNDAFGLCVTEFCRDFVELDGASTGDFVFLAADSIRSIGQIESGQAIYDAGIQVVLDPDFEVNTSAVLEVYLDGCSN